MRLRPAPLAGSWLRGLKPGHKLVWHTTGIEAGEALLQAIDAAQVTIDAQLYILEADTVSQRVVAALVRARQRGVRVRLLLDGLGCSDCDSEHLGQLVAAGAAVRVYKPLRWSVPWKHWIRRNHRKLFLFDHDSAIVGGRNVGAHYLALGEPDTTWLDLSAQVRGPVVITLARQLNHDWHTAGHKRTSIGWLRWLDGVAPSADLLAAQRASQAVSNHAWPSPPLRSPHRGGTKLAAAISQGKARSNPIAEHYVQAVRQARATIWLVHAYFLPDHKLTTALVKAVARGVQVCVLLPDLRTTDVKLVSLASLHGLDRLMRAGVQVRLNTVQNLHAKFAVIDNVWWTVGSANLDPLSRKRNLEANLVGHGREPGHTLATLARNWFAQAQPWDEDQARKRPLWLRLLGRLAWRFRALL